MRRIAWLIAIFRNLVSELSIGIRAEAIWRSLVNGYDIDSIRSVLIARDAICRIDVLRQIAEIVIFKPRYLRRLVIQHARDCCMLGPGAEARRIGLTLIRIPHTVL